MSLEADIYMEGVSLQHATIITFSDNIYLLSSIYELQLVIYQVPSNSWGTAGLWQGYNQTVSHSPGKFGELQKGSSFCPYSN